MFCLVPIIANTAYLTNPWLVRVKAGINLRGIISYLNIELFHLLQRLIKQWMSSLCWIIYQINLSGTAVQRTAALEILASCGTRPLIVII